MASDTASRTLNNYTGQILSEQQPQAQASNSMAGSTSSAEAATTPNTTNTNTSAANDGTSSVPKDEVGWYFVEQYYTTLSKNPEKLHLFYSKRSQFVSGVEAEKVSVSVGQRAINERIKELDISDCKVRVSNVDSQESFKNIVVQVIGEMSNKAAPHRKFVQTFVLAEQPNGYFVLNDIFRYIVEEEEEEQRAEPEPSAVHEPPPTVAPEAEIATLTSSADPAQQQHDVEQVDKKLQEELEESSQGMGAESAEGKDALEEVTLDAAEVNHANDAPVAAVKDQEAENPREAVEEDIDLVESQTEKPKDPDPTPVASPPKPAKATPVQAQTAATPLKPAPPKTWANLVAANRVLPPAVPGSATSTAPTPSQPKASQTAVPKQTTPPQSTSDDTSNRPQANGNAGWQTAGQDNTKRQNRQHSNSGNSEKDNVLGYVKNVTEKVDASLLKAALVEHGKLAYFDVSRQKVCSFSKPIILAVADQDYSSRTVPLWSSPILQVTTALSLRIHTISAGNRSGLRSDVLGLMPMAASTMPEETCAGDEEDPKVAEVVRDVVDTPRTGDEEVILPVGEAGT
ncbi:MAG: hypothetical protein Q9191_001036 [Dirinaria sp. TL-2023a]